MAVRATFVPLVLALLAALSSGCAAGPSDATTRPAPSLAAVAPATAPATAPARIVRIACAGDSMTRRPVGASYSHHLAALLGDGYDVRNFGHDGVTALKDSYRPFWTVPEFQAATSFAPDIVILMLGTNDASSPDDKRPAFADDYLALVRHFQGLPSAPRVILLTPPPLMLGRDDHRTKKLKDELSPIVRQIGAAEKLTVVELQEDPALADPAMYPDKVHTNVEGAKVVAQRVRDALGANGEAAGSATTRPARQSTQFGAERLDFEVSGHAAFLIRPRRPAADGSRPWLWYAPTFAGKLPNQRHAWIMTQLLDAGFAIAGIDVGESYGNPRGRAAYAALHEALTRDFDLTPKACLLPQSRGGLMLYNWAAEHPDQVQCIGGIYTVCDLASYPGLERAAPAYDMSAAQLGKRLAEHNPIDRLKPLADRKVPIFHIAGDADTLVPTDRNSGELVERYAALGGPAELVLVAGKGHEETDEFFRSQQLVDFFLKSAAPPNR